MPYVTITRRLTFNAAHRVHNPELSDEENRRLFGKCNNPNWHGHNYVLEVSVAGEIDPETGYVVDLGDLAKVVERHFVDRVDHKNLNLDVEFMRGVNPTSENIVVQCWRVIAPHVTRRRATARTRRSCSSSRAIASACTRAARPRHRTRTRTGRRASGHWPPARRSSRRSCAASSSCSARTRRATGC